MYETRIDALVSKFRSSGDKKVNPELLCALHLLNATNVDDVQRVSIMAARVSKMSVLGCSDSKAKNFVFVQNVT